MAESSQRNSPPSTRPKSYTSGALTGSERIVYPYPTESSDHEHRNSPTSSAYRTYPADDFSFETTLSGRFVLKVYKASVTRLDVDVIVNAANDTMAHGGGVAKVISDAAGYDIDRESKANVDKYGPLGVGENIVTTAGALPYRAVIHAVGPEWYRYRDKILCLDDLYDCIYNILATCKKMRFPTVAMTAISAGIFGVPKQLCADMYVYAAANFSSTLPPSACPREFHIVDIDTSILRLVEESVQRWRKDPESLNARRAVPEFLKDNPHLSRSSNSDDDNEDKRSHTGQSKNYKSERNITSSDIVSSVDKIKDERFSWGGVAKQFVVDNQIKVKIYQGDISKVRNMDTLVCGINKTLEPQGFIADVLKNAGGNAYTKSCHQMIEEKKKGRVNFSDVFKCDGGNLDAKYVLYAVINRVLDADRKETDAYRDCISSVLWEVQRNGWKRVAIPMIGTGTIQTNERKLKLCGKALLKALDEFVLIQGGHLKVQEIHLVNNKHGVDSALVMVFDEAADLQITAGNRKTDYYTNIDSSESNWQKARSNDEDSVSSSDRRANRSYRDAISRSDRRANGSDWRTNRSDGDAISRSDRRANSSDEDAISRGDRRANRSDEDAISRSDRRADRSEEDAISRNDRRVDRSDEDAISRSKWRTNGSDWHSNRSDGDENSKSHRHANKHDRDDISKSDRRTHSKSNGDVVRRTNGHASNKSKGDKMIKGNKQSHGDAYHNNHSSRGKGTYSNGISTERNRRENKRSHNERNRKWGSHERGKENSRYANETQCANDGSSEDELDKGQGRWRPDRETQDGNMTIIDD